MTLNEFLSLNPGDKVRVMPGYTDEIRNVDFITEMEPFFGKELTIQWVEVNELEELGFSRAKVEENDFWWCACEFLSKTNPIGLEELI